MRTHSSYTINTMATDDPRRQDMILTMSSLRVNFNNPRHLTLNSLRPSDAYMRR